MKSIASSVASGVLQDTLRPLATILHRRLALPLFLLCAVLLARPCRATPGQWDFTGSLSFLTGDTTADGSVNSADISQTKSQSGNPVTGANFRQDVNADGNLNSADISLVKSKSGTALP